jgi:hypothetical protein
MKATVQAITKPPTDTKKPIDRNPITMSAHVAASTPTSQLDDTTSNLRVIHR